MVKKIEDIVVSVVDQLYDNYFIVLGDRKMVQAIADHLTTLCCCMCMYCAYKLFMLWVLLVSISLREYLVPLYCLLASYLTVSFYLSPHYVGVTLSSLLLVFLLAAFLQCLSKAQPSTLLSRTGVVHRYLVSSLVCNIIFG